MRESSVAQRVLYEAAKCDINLMRNNSGAGAVTDDYGVERHIRWGLMNESKKQNELIKSSDYIGITPVNAYVELPGLAPGWYRLGVFTAVETKPSDWSFRQSDKRAVAQLAFHDMVRGYGGFAGFATGPDDIKRICFK